MIAFELELCVFCFGDSDVLLISSYGHSALFDPEFAWRDAKSPILGIVLIFVVGITASVFMYHNV